MANQPNLMAYRNYRAYLLDHYEWKKERRPSYSWRQLAEMAGLASPNYLNLVVHGKRNLTEENAVKVAAALKLEPDESAFFCALVALDRAESGPQRSAVEMQIAAMVQRFGRTRLAGDQLKMLKTWPTFILFEALRMEGVDTRVESLVELLENRVTKEQIELSLALLRENGLVAEIGGKLKPTSDAEVSVFHHQDPGLTRVYFAECLQAWKGVLPQVQAHEGTFRVVTLPANLACIDELKAKVRVFQDELVAWMESQPDKDRVVQLCLLCLPVTGSVKES